MLKIRLQRTGRKHEPTFRIVLTESKNGPKSGKFLEVLGSYDARRNEDAQLKKDRIQYWIGQGVQISDTMHNLLVTHGIIAGEKKNVLPQKTPIRKEQPVTEEATAPVAEAPVEESASEVAQEVSETPVEAPAEEVATPVEETPVAEVTEEVKE